ncbi:unnamed protein product [Cylindrotheca closterium]|uniref:Ricin B lectin domain-containing protein n=1 Tax=Cylindrotheca closterium TaxID=2856 RepID=A0AAD2CI29_9STRA|nr:unnamed protein product [Cylindrotheca closterium]
MKEITNDTTVTNDEESDNSLSNDVVVVVAESKPTIIELASQDPFFRYAKQFLVFLTGRRVMGAIAFLVAISLILVLTLTPVGGGAAVDTSVAATAESSTTATGATSPTTSTTTTQPEARPSMAPLPTQEPSTMPTLEPAVSPSFQLRLHWEDGYYWQESREEMFYCMECADCDEYTTGDGRDGDCRSRGSSSARCREGHLVWIEWCNRRDYQFEIIQHYNSGSQVRVHGTDLCFSTVYNRYLELRVCNQTDALQLWSPIADTKKFELRPFDQRNLTRDDARCLSQQHHPKSEELVGLHSCAEARQDETVYWAEYHR